MRLSPRPGKSQIRIDAIDAPSILDFCGQGWSMGLTERDAKAILQAAHHAWTEGDVEGTLACYREDLTYVCNTGGIDGAPLEISGKVQFRDFLLPVMETVNSSTTVDQFRFEDETGRALIGCSLRHRKTGLELFGTYKQIVTFSGGKIMRMSEFHDASRMAAFWRLVLTEEEEPGLSIFRVPAQSETTLSWRGQLPPNWNGTKSK